MLVLADRPDEWDLQPEHTRGTATLTWEGSEPDSIWPVIMPGMLTMPTTFIWFRMGVSATRVARCSVSCAASHRLAPMASFSSMRSLPAGWHSRNNQRAGSYCIQ